MSKTLWPYVLVSVLLLVLLGTLRYYFFAQALALEGYMGLIGIFFLVFGFWLSHQWRKTQSPSPPPPAHTSGESIAPNELLSPREQEVLALLNNGCTNQEIAQQLFLSTNTVKTHIASIYSKLDVNRRTQALAKARSMGLIQ